MESSLLISPKEQTEVMERIFGNNSHYSEETRNRLKQVMLVPEESGADLSIYGKTGMGKAEGVTVDAWFTGFAERAEGNVYFCVRLGETDGKDVSSTLAKEIAVKIVSDYCMQQTAGELKITAEGVPVEVRLAEDGQYGFEYDKNEYAVTTAEKDSVFEIKVTDVRPETDYGGNVVVYIPNQNYTLITGISEGSSFILPAINVNITMISNASSAVINLPSDYNKTLNYRGSASSCSLSMGGVKEFAVDAAISSSAVQVPRGWPAYDMLSSSYNYTNGNGGAKIKLDLTSSSFLFN